MGQIRTWHANSDEPTSRAPSPKPVSRPSEPSPNTAKGDRPNELADFLTGLIGRQATFYLLAPLGWSNGGAIVTGRIRGVRKYEILIDRPEGALVLRKDAIAAIEPADEPRTP